MHSPIRLAAMMKLHVIYVFTHDSIALGQDGSTHQPVEQLAGLRAIPGLTISVQVMPTRRSSLGAPRSKPRITPLRWF